MVAPVYASTASTVIYNITTNTWSAGPSILHGQDESGGVKLADGSILTVDGQSTTSERYIPAQNKWVNDGTLPVNLWDGEGEEGPGLLLPSGKVFFLGATGHTAIYTPTGAASPGTWIAGPDIPNSQGTDDAPGAMMVNGVELCAVGPLGTYNSPTSFYEYDPVANAFTQVNVARPARPSTPCPSDVRCSICQTVACSYPEPGASYTNLSPPARRWPPAGRRSPTLPQATALIPSPAPCSMAFPKGRLTATMRRWIPTTRSCAWTGFPRIWYITRGPQIGAAPAS